jgi:hypothetical protein
MRLSVAGLALVARSLPAASLSGDVVLLSALFNSCVSICTEVFRASSFMLVSMGGDVSVTLGSASFVTSRRVWKVTFLSLLTALSCPVNE